MQAMWAMPQNAKRTILPERVDVPWRISHARAYRWERPARPIHHEGGDTTLRSSSEAERFHPHRDHDDGMLSGIIAPLSRKKPMQAFRVMAIAPGHWHTRSVVIDERLLTARVSESPAEPPSCAPRRSASRQRLSCDAIRAKSWRYRIKSGMGSWSTTTLCDPDERRPGDAGVARAGGGRSSGCMDASPHGLPPLS
jgi:hypothetical protein